MWEPPASGKAGRPSWRWRSSRAEPPRDWGCHCWCAPGKDGPCGRRLQGQLGSLSEGYNHKDTCSEIGFNLKVTDLRAAVGVALLRKLPAFVATRKRNGRTLRERLRPLEAHSIAPQAAPEAVTDLIMQRSFGVGVYPALTAEMLESVVETITAFVRGGARGR